MESQPPKQVKSYHNDFQNDESLVVYCKDSLFYQVLMDLLDYCSDVCNGDLVKFRRNVFD